MTVKNAIIMAAGTSSRFVPLSVERPKGLLEVKGEILIERQIRQLQEAGINDITIVVGYKAEMFRYLIEKYGVDIVLNENYQRYNNISSLVKVLDRLCNTYICSSDNYFPQNIFLDTSVQSYYSALYSEGQTNEYCIQYDGIDNITGVTVGGESSWYMTGPAFFAEEFSIKFKEIIIREYSKEETKLGYWEDLYIRFIDAVPAMKIKRYPPHEIEEFDSIDELRAFDQSYIDNTRSIIIKKIASLLECEESELWNFSPVRHGGDAIIFTFNKAERKYHYNLAENCLTQL